ncbi:hypothetical protein C2E23DRAFT_739360 [Lenzites betulinus]|nr:hypothetical protein C2E23DRAFT_739360 [Lenzites betulinus]
MSFREPRPLLDKHGRIFAVLAGSPYHDDWKNVVREAQGLYEDARRQFGTNDEDYKHRRGYYPAVGAGLSYGGGQQFPKNLKITGVERDIANTLLRSTAVRRIANFASAAMQAYAPRLYAHYSRTLDALVASSPSMKPNFQNNVFGAAYFNLGPRVVTLRHKDFQNLAWGWCSVTAMGDFNPSLGGHIVLWDLNMMIEFPPGSTILIPSALLLHSNIAIQPGETRFSLTQFSAGGLFRWVECDFRSQYQYEQAGGVLPSGQDRWNQGISMYSTWAELCVDE